MIRNSNDFIIGKDYERLHARQAQHGFDPNGLQPTTNYMPQEKAGPLSPDNEISADWTRDAVSLTKQLLDKENSKKRFGQRETGFSQRRYQSTIPALNLTNGSIFDEQQ